MHDSGVRFARASRRSAVLLLLALTVLGVVAASATANSGPSLRILLAPRHPGAANHYKITLKGRAPRGHLSKTRNKSEIDIVEQLGGHCARTPQAELAKSKIEDLGPLFVAAGKFSFSELRTATASRHTTIRFCGYLSTGVHAVVARATIAYTT